MTDRDLLELIAQKVASIDNEVKELKQGQAKIETRIEHDITNKIQVAFEAIHLNSQKLENLDNILQLKLDEHDQKLADIFSDTKYLVARVNKLEKLAK